MRPDTFEGLMIKAETMYKLDAEKSDYWRGYIRGLRRAHHGENFGTDAEHDLYLSQNDNDDPGRRELGRGYREGLAALEKGGTL